MSETTIRDILDVAARGSVSVAVQMIRETGGSIRIDYDWADDYERALADLRRAGATVEDTSSDVRVSVEL